MTQRVDEHTDSALNFLRALSPLDGLFPADYRRSYIFRGVGSENHGLVPSAFRKGVLLRYFSEIVTGPLKTERAQIRAEVSTLWEFFNAADRQGLRLPEDSQDLREVFKDYVSVSDGLFETVESGEGPWPPNHLISLMALAQHYGVPTRLLDWTWDPYIAAYFAAANAQTDSAKICVWALSLVYDEIQELLGGPIENKLHLVSAPASDNQNLRAQRWVGLLYRQVSVSDHSPLVYRAYDELIDNAFGSEWTFFRLTLPVSESGELLRLLSILNIDGSTIFPGFGGAARVIQDMARWPTQQLFRESGRPTEYWAAQEAFFKRRGLFKDRKSP